MSNNCATQNYNPLYVGDSMAITANLALNPNLNGLLAGLLAAGSSARWPPHRGLGPRPKRRLDIRSANGID
jgi:hypothetical protein